jgi:hypothetical protein
VPISVTTGFKNGTSTANGAASNINMAAKPVPAIHVIRRDSKRGFTVFTFAGPAAVTGATAEGWLLSDKGILIQCWNYSNGLQYIIEGS